METWNWISKWKITFNIFNLDVNLIVWFNEFGLKFNPIGNIFFLMNDLNGFIFNTNWIDEFSQLSVIELLTCDDGGEGRVNIGSGNWLNKLELQSTFWIH